MDSSLRQKMLHALYETKDITYVREQAYFVITSPELTKDALDFIISIADETNIHKGQICEEMTKEAAERFLSEGTEYDWLAEHPTADRSIVYNYLLNEVKMERVTYFLQNITTPADVRNKIYQKFADVASVSMLYSFLEDDMISAQSIKALYFKNPNLDYNTRYRIFRHPNAPIKVLMHGLEKHSNLLHVIIDRGEMSDSVLLKILKGTKDYVARNIASRPNISLKIVDAVLARPSYYATLGLLDTQMSLPVPRPWQDYVWVKAPDAARMDFIKENLTRLENIPVYVKVESILAYNLNESDPEYFKKNSVDFKEAFDAYVKNFTNWTKEELDGLPADWVMELVKPHVIERLGVNG